jgi:hypothetical protein
MENREKKHVLTYEDLLELEGLGWILYVPLRSIYLNKHNKIQLSIETKKDSIDMVCNFILILSICTVYMTENNIVIPLFSIANRICKNYSQL